MIYTPLTNQAMKIAYQAHQGQRDYNGVPYIFHPFHVAEKMKDEITVCVALLHDVLEDTEVTLEELEAVFPPRITEAVQLLTHEKKEPYPEYIRRIKDNPIAKAVKLEDIAHNMDESRIAGNPAVTEEKKLHWRKKYQEAIQILQENG